MAQQVDYVGKADVRVVRSADLASQGFISPDLVWNKGNNYELLISDDALAAWLLAADSGFQIQNPSVIFTDIFTSLNVPGDLTLPISDLSDPAAVDGGVIRRTHSVIVPWNYTQTTDPVQANGDPAHGTAFHVDAHVTLSAGQGLDGPNFSTGNFGPRGVFNFEGVVRYGQNMTLLSCTPIGYLDSLVVMNTPNVARDITPAWSFVDARQYLAQGATVTLMPTDTNSGGAGFVSTPVLATTDGGQINGNTNDTWWTSFLSQPGVFGNVSIDGRIGLDIEGCVNETIGGPLSGPYPYGSGEDVGDVDVNNISIGEELGIRIGAFALGTTKTGMESVHPVIANEGFFGSRAAAGNMILGSTRHATKGFIELHSRINPLPTDITWTSTTEGYRIFQTRLDRTITLNDTGGGFNFGNEFTGVSFLNTVVFDAPPGVFGMGSFFSGASTIKNAPGEARAMGIFVGQGFQPVWRGDGAAVTTAQWVGLQDNPKFEGINGGTISATSVSVRSNLEALAGSTLTSRKGVEVNDGTGAGAVTLQVGVDISTLAKGATNIGVRNASTYVATPPSPQAITAVGNTISPTAHAYEISNTTGGSLTLTSAPTIPNGQPGQLLVLTNVGTQNVVLQDQGTLANSNLRLAAAAVTLGPLDSMLLRFVGGSVNDWVQVAPVLATV